MVFYVFSAQKRIFTKFLYLTNFAQHSFPLVLLYDYSIICSYDVTGADFENSQHAFGQSEKRERVQCIIISIKPVTDIIKLIINNGFQSFQAVVRK